MTIPPPVQTWLCAALTRLRAGLENDVRPAIRGAGPGTGFAEDPQLDKELAELLDPYVCQAKLRHLDIFEKALPAERATQPVVVARASLGEWLACLNDVRLMLAGELKIKKGWSFDIHDQIAGHGEGVSDSLLLFLCMSALQEMVLEKMQK